MTAASRLVPSAVLAVLALADPVHAQPAAPESKAPPTYTRTEDVVYGHHDGMALTLDVFTPKEPNGAAVIVFVSAEFRSGRDGFALFHPLATTPFLDRGYTVFAVMHASQPKYTVPEIVEDAHRAVRFVRHNARKYGVDPDRIGVTGGSSGGHLCLMVGCTGKLGNPRAADPVDRESSRPAAVACMFPPTDFLALDGGPKDKDVTAAFDFRERDRDTGKLERVTAERRREIGRAISPITHAARGAAPALIIHGDKDKVVPIAQSERMIAELKKCEVTCELRTKPGAGHFEIKWVRPELPKLADWFDTHLVARRACPGRE
jgi:acetyl esterase/lipase